MHDLLQLIHISFVCLLIIDLFTTS